MIIIKTHLTELQQIKTELTVLCFCFVLFFLSVNMPEHVFQAHTHKYCDHTGAKCLHLLFTQSTAKLVYLHSVMLTTSFFSVYFLFYLG